MRVNAARRRGGAASCVERDGAARCSWGRSAAAAAAAGAAAAADLPSIGRTTLGTRAVARVLLKRRVLVSVARLPGSVATCAVAFTLSRLTVVWPVFAVLVLFGSARAFMMPAQQAILMNLVPADSFGKAVAISSSSFHVAVIVGPTLGGLLYLAGSTIVYAIVAALLLASLLASVLLMGLARATQQPRRSEPTSLGAVLEGLRFVGSRPAVLGAISLDLFAVLFGGAVALLPAYARDVLHAGPTGLGMLRTAPAVGAALTAGVLAFRPITRHVGRWMFGGVAVFGLATIGLGQTHSFPAALVALFLVGAGDMVSVYIRHILVQLETPDAIRGRVSAVNAVFIGASNELGEFESGLTAGWLGLLPAILLGGGATLVVAALWALGFPVLSRMDRFPHAKRDPEESEGRAGEPEAAAAA
ncbi:MFS transporter [Sorangium sp. So ce341]|uniref:MFS transporter n=1 Tax=Sorangium sp. So ce341 TaxID=3133302 RepID=UPI003F5F9C3F